VAEFCLDCWNKMNHILLSERDVVLSNDLDFCENCGTWKPVVVKYKKPCGVKRLTRKFKGRLL